MFPMVVHPRSIALLVYPTCISLLVYPTVVYTDSDIGLALATVVYLFGVFHRFQHFTGHIMTGSWEGRGNQYIQFLRVLYCKLPTNGKQLPAFPLEAVPGSNGCVHMICITASIPNGCVCTPMACPTLLYPIKT